MKIWWVKLKNDRKTQKNQCCFWPFFKIDFHAWCHFWLAPLLLFAKKSHKRDSLRWPEFAIIAKFLTIDLWFGFLEHVFKLPLKKNDCTAYEQEVNTRPVHQFIESLDNQIKYKQMILQYLMKFTYLINKYLSYWIKIKVKIILIKSKTIKIQFYLIWIRLIDYPNFRWTGTMVR